MWLSLLLFPLSWFFLFGGDGGWRIRSFGCLGGLRASGILGLRVESVGVLEFCGLGPGFGFRLEVSLFFEGAAFQLFVLTQEERPGFVLRSISVFWDDLSIFRLAGFWLASCFFA